MKAFRLILVFILSFLFININCYAQSLYQENRKQGISLYNVQKYDDAITRFNLAKSAPDKPSQNDIDEWIKKCNQAKQRIADEIARQEEAERQRVAEQRERERQEQARQEQLRRERERESANARKGYMEISRVQFANGPGDGSITNDYGSTLYASDIKYLYAKAYIQSLTNTSRDLTLYVKIYKPDGTLMTGSSSPSGYTNSFSKTITSSSTYVLLNGWGNKNGGTYTPGQYRYEIWYQNNKLYSTHVTLNRKANEATYLKVDSKTSVSTTFDWDGDSETFYVSTDADEWTTWGVPSWCSVENKSSSSFTLRCQANNSTSEKTDYMKIKAGDKEVRIDIKQRAKPGPSATVNNIWVDHNVFNGYIKGMKIHINVDVENMKGRTVKYCVFFYLEDNSTKLVNMWGNHISSSMTSNCPYESTNWNDWWIFVPYNNIFGAANATGRYSFDVEIQDTNGHALGRKDNFQFYQY